MGAATADTTNNHRTHGSAELPSVHLTSYNLEIRDQDGFVGDKASPIVLVPRSSPSSRAWSGRSSKVSSGTTLLDMPWPVACAAHRGERRVCARLEPDDFRWDHEVIPSEI